MKNLHKIGLLVLLSTLPATLISAEGDGPPAKHAPERNGPARTRIPRAAPPCSPDEAKTKSAFLERTAEGLLSAKKAGQTSLDAVLKKAAPQIVQQLEGDAQLTEWKRLWGESLNYDEGAKHIIVDPEIVSAIAAFFNPPFKSREINGKPIVHAGMEHTYGYLFSQIKTPYGYKRERWVSGEIENGFGLPCGLIGPTPNEGTLFSNVTYLIGKIAFRHDPVELKKMEKEKSVPDVLRKFDFSKLRIQRLEETVEITKPPRKLVIRTDFVPFLNPSQGSDTYLLVYSIVDSQREGPVLITTFPVNEKAITLVTAADSLGNDKPIRSRYNAYVEGIGETELKGVRRFFSDEIPSVK